MKRPPGEIAALVLRALLIPLAAVPLNGNRRCVLCGNRVGRFLPFERGWRGAPALTRALGTVGSDPDHFECPRCASHDRERHLFLYMSRTGLLSGLAGKHVVHFAPEVHLSRRIKAQGLASYTPCDLFPTSPDVRREDLLSMSVASGSVDVFIANHVLEHVADDLKAMAEIRRVLKPGGIAVLQTPFSPMLSKTWEDPGITSPEARLQAFGQADHVRLYGRDIFERLASCGFIARVQTHAELLADVDPDEAGVNAREPFMLFERAE
jgi:SAM-dependent methyltransferase